MGWKEVRKQSVFLSISLSIFSKKILVDCISLNDQNSLSFLACNVEGLGNGFLKVVSVNRSGNPGKQIGAKKILPYK